MLSQEPVNPRQIKPESCREPETSSPFQQRNVNLQPPRKSVGCYNEPGHYERGRSDPGRYASAGAAVDKGTAVSCGEARQGSPVAGSGSRAVQAARAPEWQLRRDRKS